VTASSPHAEQAVPRAGLGARVRELRIERGLTQAELAGERFSKEYVSQIELGKTRPTPDTIVWIARRLGVEHGYLETGIRADERERVEAAIARAEAAVEAGNWEDAIAEIEQAGGPLEPLALPRLEFRAILVESWARLYAGEPRLALDRLTRAQELVETVGFTDTDRAEVLFRLGCCRFKLNSISTATALFTEAYELATRTELPADRLRSHILGWRSRCHQRHRDWVAAREDVEHALELAERLNDRRMVAHTYFQASLVAERTGQWVLARSYAESAKAEYEEIADQVNVGKLLNNLGGLTFLLGKPEEAVSHLKEAFRVAVEVDNEVDAGYAVSSLAQVHQRIGENGLAEEEARRALALLGDRVEYLDEIGNAQLVLGRALLEQSRFDEADEAFGLAERSFSQISSASHVAAAWLAQGDLAARRGDDRAAAQLYRRAAEALQDFRF
jgi:transcriptional regulator with XRE-family HTH domain/Tfp pilus assembly protein PilF